MPLQNHVIKFDSQLTIRNANAIVATLKDALSSHIRVELDCEENTEIDLWFVQLLIAASKGFKQQARELALSEQLTDSLAEILRAGGFPNPFPPGERSLWLRPF